MDATITFGVRLVFEIIKWIFTDDNLGPQAKTGRVDPDLRGRPLNRIRLQQSQADRLRAGRQSGSAQGDA
jgi:hypothetical protein